MAAAKVSVQQIQWRPRAGRAAPPLFLIHDSSGLLFNYHLLHDLNRDVYGIADPLFGTDQCWRGGIPEMARAYISAIKSTISQGPIVLGGWSLGGMIAIEMCTVLYRSISMILDVRGLILIDTPNTQGWKALWSDLEEFDLDLSKASPRVRQGVNRRSEFAEKLVYDWEFPSLTDHANPPLSATGCSRSFFSIGDSPNGLAVLRSDKNLSLSLQLQAEKSLLPPALLMRAVDHVKPHAKSPIRVDLSREKPMLGWEDHPISFIRAVQDTPGHHYDLFDGDHRVMMVTETIKGWCSILDDAWIRSKGMLGSRPEKRKIMMEKSRATVVQDVPMFWI